MRASLDLADLADWLPSTVARQFWRTGAYRRQCILTPDGGLIALDWFEGCDTNDSIKAHVPILLVLHGLTGAKSQAVFAPDHLREHAWGNGLLLRRRRQSGGLLQGHMRSSYEKGLESRGAQLPRLCWQALSPSCCLKGVK